MHFFNGRDFLFVEIVLGLLLRSDDVVVLKLLTTGIGNFGVTTDVGAYFSLLVQNEDNGANDN
jgi:hypothetical protein